MKLLIKLKNIYKKAKHNSKMRRSPNYHLDYILRYGTTKYLDDIEKEEIYKELED